MFIRRSYNLVILLLVFCTAVHSQSTAPWQGIGRIAISSDGNEHDHDDWAATPFSLALLAAAGLQEQMVLYTYSDHVWGSNEEHPVGSNTTAIGARAEMKISALDGADWFGFDRSRFIEAVGNPENAYNAMRDAINASSAGNPLLIIGAGPMHVIGEGIHRAQVQKRQYVTVISHSNWNNNHTHNNSWTWAKMQNTFANQTGGNLKMIKITDQNGGTGYDGMRAATAKFDWIKNSTARDHAAYLPGSWDWLYSRQQTCIKQGEFDPSDAGMIIYMLTGIEKTNPSDAQQIMENPVSAGNSSSSSSSSSSSTINSSSSLASSSADAIACTKVYAEIETAQPQGYWKLHTQKAGYNGTGYLYWDGPNTYGSPNENAVLTYSVNILEGGEYRLAFRGRRDLEGVCAGAASDECNDIFVKVNTGNWVKTMVKGPWGNWHWQSAYEPAGHGVINAVYTLHAGINTIKVTGRSEGVKLDAFSIYPNGTAMVTSPVAGCETATSSSSSGTSSSNTGSSSSQAAIVADITDLQAVSTQESITLSWSPVANAQAYRVRRKLLAEATYTNIADVGHQDSEYIDTGVAVDQTYVYMVRPLVDGKAVALSNTVEASLQEASVAIEKSFTMPHAHIANHTLTVNAQQQGIWSIQVYSLQGKLMSTQTHSLHAGQHQLLLPKHTQPCILFIQGPNFQSHSMQLFQ